MKKKYNIQYNIKYNALLLYGLNFQQYVKEFKLDKYTETAHTLMHL